MTPQRAAGLTTLSSVAIHVLTMCHCGIDLSFPPGFKFGASTAAYQIEGGWNASDKSPNLWDKYTHEKPSGVVDGSNGDVAGSSYRLWRQDVEAAREIGLHYYRFSISWSRLLPSGFPNKISADGKRYYNNLINGLLKNGIEPLVTIYHFDVPQRLMDFGGWTNPSIADWFAEYARVVFSLYGDRVKTFVTINEALMECTLGYGGSTFPPALNDMAVANLLCSKNMLLAHAKAWRVYDEEFRHRYRGKVSMTNVQLWFEADTPADKEITELARQYANEIFTHPIYSKEGGWPVGIERMIAKNSVEEGFPYSRLPAFTEDERKLVRGTYDFIAINYYITLMVRGRRRCEEAGEWPLGGGWPELQAIFEWRPEWERTDSPMFVEYPEGLRRVLVDLKRKYGDIEIIITENGYPSSDKSLNDDRRIRSFRRHLEQLLLAIKVDGVNVTGYTVWSLIDTFEWCNGYSYNFGLYAVDINDNTRKRTARKSSRYYSSIIKAHSLDVPMLKEEL